MGGPPAPRRSLLRRIPWTALIGLTVLAAAIWALHHELSHASIRDIRAAVASVPLRNVLLALGLTVLSFGVLTLYDTLAVRYTGLKLAWHRTALASFVGYAFSNALGAALLIGSGVRWRLYSAWGLEPGQFARIVSFYAVTPWVGLAALAGVLVVAGESTTALRLPFDWLRPVGWLLVLLVVAWVALSFAFKGRDLKIRGVAIPVPAPQLAILQVVIASIDWVVAGLVLWVLLPVRVPFAAFALTFLAGHLAGAASQVPGGLGVFESVFLLSMSDGAPDAALVAALVVYRAIYYLLPLLLAIVTLSAHEVHVRRDALARASAKIGNAAAVWTPELAPHAVAVATFLCGAVLLFSGATPAIIGRYEWIRTHVPLPAIESAHFLASVAGAGLLVCARGLWLRLSAAATAARVLLVIGIVASLAKGGDFEEAVVLGITLGAVISTADAYHRPAKLTSEPFSPGWIAAVVAVFGASLWLGYFAFRRVDYSHDLWWTFAHGAELSRFLRASAGAAMLLLWFGIAELLSPSADRALPPTPTVDEQERAAALARRADEPDGFLALLGDKRLLFDDRDRAFLMYGVSGRVLMALGDPIGDPSAGEELAWRFVDLADHVGALPCFYEVGPDHLPLYLDLGLSLVKLGEDAVVDLHAFDLDAQGRKSLRAALHNGEREGLTFDVVPAGEVRALLPELHAVSDAWLAKKHTREKGFSLGFFDERYLAHFPVAVVRHGDAVVAFANLWPGREHGELSLDLMRYDPARAPHGVMDFLFVNVLRWGRAEGWSRFNLGMAPLAGLETRPAAPMWHKVGGTLFRHGEHFYDFAGLREFKAKFDPVWRPQYLAWPGGWSRLPTVLAASASLVSRGLVGAVRR